MATETPFFIHLPFNHLPLTFTHLILSQPLQQSIQRIVQDMNVPSQNLHHMPADSLGYFSARSHFRRHVKTRLNTDRLPLQLATLEH